MILRSNTLRVWRGHKPIDQRPADPGDFGIGTYYTTSRARARQYGALQRHVLTMRNPLIMMVSEAYDTGERFGTIHGTWESRFAAAHNLTMKIRARGHDFLVVDWSQPTFGKGRAELEIIDMSNICHSTVDKYRGLR